MQDSSAGNTALKTYLEKRRSVPAIRLVEPGPSRETVEAMIAMASRVPDHGKLAPWRFVVYSGAARARLGEELADIAASSKELGEDELVAERQRLARAPVVIAVVSRAQADHPKVPEWEQVLSAGAAAYGLFMAANALGFGANWLTEWYAYDRQALSALGIGEDEKVAGFIHVGTPDFTPPDRPRPDLADIVTWVE